MADVSIVKLKGELGYTLDTRRLYVGDGASVGGRAVNNFTYGPFALDSNLNIEGAELGDIGYANGKLYVLSGTNINDTLSGWAYIGPVPGSTLDFGPNNTLIVAKV